MKWSSFCYNVDFATYAQRCLNVYNQKHHATVMMREITREAVHEMSVMWHKHNAKEAEQITAALMGTQTKFTRSNILNLKKRYSPNESYLHKTWKLSLGQMTFPQELQALTWDGMWTQITRIEEVVKKIIIKAISVECSLAEKVTDEFCLRLKIRKMSLPEVELEMERERITGGRGMRERHSQQVQRLVKLVELNRGEVIRSTENMRSRRAQFHGSTIGRSANLTRFIREQAVDQPGVEHPNIPAVRPEWMEDEVDEDEINAQGAVAVPVQSRRREIRFEGFRIERDLRNRRNNERNRAARLLEIAERIREEHDENQ